MTYIQVPAVDIIGQEVAPTVSREDYSNQAQVETPLEELFDEGELDVSIPHSPHGYSDQLLKLCGSGLPRLGQVGHRRSDWYHPTAAGRDKD